jgi:hypothetical protein
VGLELDAIAASVLGGVSLFDGAGGLSATALFSHIAQQGNAPGGQAWPKRRHPAAQKGGRRWRWRYNTRFCARATRRAIRRAM